MNARLMALGNIFSGSDIRWQLDGALNISLMKGRFIGVHKDVDISLDPQDLEKLETQLRGHGYGLFRTEAHPDDTTKKLIRRLTPQEARERPEALFQIAAVDEHGKLRSEPNLNFMDVHLIRRDTNGNPLGYGNVALPDKWYKPQPMDFHGQTINLSHPAKVAYFKLHSTRPFDRTDLRTLTLSGKLSQQDAADIRRIIEEEIAVQRSKAEAIVAEATKVITPKMAAAGIFQAFADQPVLQSRLEDEPTKKLLHDLAEEIARGNRSLTSIRTAAFETFGLEHSLEKTQKKVDELLGWIEGAAKKEASISSQSFP